MVRSRQTHLIAPISPWKTRMNRIIVQSRKTDVTSPKLDTQVGEMDVVTILNKNLRSSFLGLFLCGVEKC